MASMQEVRAAWVHKEKASAEWLPAWFGKSATSSASLGAAGETVSQINKISRDDIYRMWV